MTGTPLIAVSLLLASTLASAETKLTVRVSIDGPSVTVSDVTEEDVKSGKLKELLYEALKQAKRAWLCDMANRCVATSRRPGFLNKP